MAEVEITVNDAGNDMIELQSGQEGYTLPIDVFEQFVVNGNTDVPLHFQNMFLRVNLEGIDPRNISLVKSTVESVTFKVR
ncbi:MAG: hypothetical protein AB1805_07525 [Nitrospirota bacterium]